MTNAAHPHLRRGIEFSRMKNLTAGGCWRFPHRASMIGPRPMAALTTYAHFMARRSGLSRQISRGVAAETFLCFFVRQGASETFGEGFWFALPGSGGDAETAARIPAQTALDDGAVVAPANRSDSLLTAAEGPLEREGLTIGVFLRDQTETRLKGQQSAGRTVLPRVREAVSQFLDFRRRAERPGVIACLLTPVQVRVSPGARARTNPGRCLRPWPVWRPGHLCARRGKGCPQRHDHQATEPVFHCVSIPRPSTMVTNRPAFTLAATSFEPGYGHSISMRSADSAVPSPKCKRRSLCDRNVDPERTSCTCLRPAAVTVTRAPMALRFDFIPTRRMDRKRSPLPRLRSFLALPSRGASLHFARMPNGFTARWRHRSFAPRSRALGAWSATCYRVGRLICGRSRRFAVYGARSATISTTRDCASCLAVMRRTAAARRGCRRAR